MPPGLKALWSLYLEWSSKEGVSQVPCRSNKTTKGKCKGWVWLYPHALAWLLCCSAQQSINTSAHYFKNYCQESFITGDMKLLEFFLTLDNINWHIVWTSGLLGLPSPTDGRDHEKGNDLMTQSPSLSCASCKCKHW